MCILIANDDGICSPGIAVLAEVAAKFGDVRVVAPDVEQSSAGHSITAMRPLSTSAHRLATLKLTGSMEHQQTVSHLALTTGKKWTLSCRGSIWEVIEETQCGIRERCRRQAGRPAGLAWHRSQRVQYTGRAKLRYSEALGRKSSGLLLEDHELTLVNVNFPDVKPKGFRWTRQSVRHYDGKVVPGEDPLGGSFSGSL